MSYAEHIRAVLVSKSTTADYEAVVQEWRYKGECHARGGACQLCGKDPIVYVFRIVNTVNGKALEVGSECIYNYAHADALAVKRDRKRLEKERKAERDLELIRAAAQKSAWIAERLENFEQGIRRYGSLHPKIRAVAKKVLSK